MTNKMLVLIVSTSRCARNAGVNITQQQHLPPGMWRPWSQFPHSHQPRSSGARVGTLLAISNISVGAGRHQFRLLSGGWRPGEEDAGEVASVATLPLVTLLPGKDTATEQDWELSCTGLAQWSGGSEPKL